MTEEPARFDPSPAFRDDVRRARARVAAMTPEAAKALLHELVATMPGLVLAHFRLVGGRRAGSGGTGRDQDPSSLAG